MNNFDTALNVCVLVFMITSLGEAGLRVPLRPALAPLHNSRFVLTTLAAGWLAGPAIAWLLLALIPLAPAYAAGLKMLALAPCAPFAPPLMRSAHGDPAHVAAFLLLTALATAALMPPAVPLLLGVPVSPWVIARPLLLLVITPLLVGMALREWQPQLAAVMAQFASAVAQAATIALLVLVLIGYGDELLQTPRTHAIITTLLFVAATTVVGHWLGAALPADERSVVTIGMATRNLGAALAPLAAVEPDPRAMVTIVLAGPITYAAAALAARVITSRAARRAAGSA